MHDLDSRETVPDFPIDGGRLGDTLVTMILVTGATGTIGSEIVRLLAERGAKVRGLTRDAARVGNSAGVEWVRGDYDDPASLAAAMEGVEAVFLVAVFGPVGHDQALVEAARAAGVRRLVKLSAIGTSEPALGRAGTWHLGGEQAVQGSGIDWTILRPTTFASNTSSWADAIRAGNPVPDMTGQGAQGVVDPRDVAEVAATVLTSPDHAGTTYTLTGPDLLTTADQVAVLSTVLGRAIDTVEVPAETVRANLLDSGMSADYVAGVLEGMTYLRSGANAVRTDDIHTVLGRSPRSYATWAADHHHLFR